MLSHCRWHDFEISQSLPNRGRGGGSGDEAKNAGVRRSRGAPADHTGVAEAMPTPAAAGRPQEVVSEVIAGVERVQMPGEFGRPEVHGAGVPEALPLLLQEDRRRHGRVRVQGRASVLQRRVPFPAYGEGGEAGDRDPRQEAP